MTPPDTAAPPAPPTWRNRIVGEADVAPQQLRANPLNFRRHPAAQKRALAGTDQTFAQVTAQRRA